MGTAAVVEMAEGGFLCPAVLFEDDGVLNVQAWIAAVEAYLAAGAQNETFGFLAVQGLDYLSLVPELHECALVGDSLFYTHVFPSYFLGPCKHLGKSMYTELLLRDIEMTKLTASEWTLEWLRTERFVGNATGEVGWLQGRDAIAESYVRQETLWASRRRKAEQQNGKEQMNMSKNVVPDKY